MFRLLLGLGLGYLGYVVVKKVAASLGLWPQTPRPWIKTRSRMSWSRTRGFQAFIPQQGRLGQPGWHRLFFLLERLFEALPQ